MEQKLFLHVIGYPAKEQLPLMKSLRKKKLPFRDNLCKIIKQLRIVAFIVIYIVI